MNNLLRKIQCQEWLIQPEALRSIMLQALKVPNALHDSTNTKDWYESLREADSKQVISKGKLSLIDCKGLQYLYLNGPLMKHVSFAEVFWYGIEDYDTLIERLYKVQADTQTIVLHVESPGGSISGMYEAMAVLEKLRADGFKVIAYVDQFCASAGYALAAACDYIVMTECAYLGGLGVKISWLDYAEMLEGLGIKQHLFVNAGSERKVMHEDGRLTDKYAAEIQANIDAEATRFRNKLGALRGAPISDEAFNGNVYKGEDAMRLNLADMVVSDFAEFIETITQPQLVASSITQSAQARS